MMINQERLKEVLYYDPDTGIFTWKVSLSNSIKIGNMAGCKRKNGYIFIMISGKYYRAHRLAWLYMTGEFPKDMIDHVDQDRSNNAFNNLRDVSNSVNQRNARRHKNNTSGITGIAKIGNNWRVAINNEGTYEQKYFPDLESAIAYNTTRRSELGYHENHGRLPIDIS
jgi:hypothetical protein